MEMSRSGSLLRTTMRVCGPWNSVTAIPYRNVAPGILLLVLRFPITMFKDILISRDLLPIVGSNPINGITLIFTITCDSETQRGPLRDTLGQSGGITYSYRGYC